MLVYYMCKETKIIHLFETYLSINQAHIFNQTTKLEARIVKPKEAAA